MLVHRRMSVISVGVTLLALTVPGVAQDKPKVVATFSILADIARNVAGDRAEVTALVGPNSDAHVYTPTPSDARTVGAASVIVTNGLGYEGWTSRLVAASGTKAAVVIASNGVKARQSMDSHGHGAADPHAWQSVANAKIYVANIRDALIKTDPGGKALYEANTVSYLARLDALEREIRDSIARIPAERRRVITSHAAFGYFKDAYGIDFIAPRGVSTDTEASARDMANIIAQIKRQKIPAVFLENIADQRLMDRIAAETGARIGGNLFSDALTDVNGAAGSRRTRDRDRIAVSPLRPRGRLPSARARGRTVHAPARSRRRRCGSCADRRRQPLLPSQSWPRARCRLPQARRTRPRPRRNGVRSKLRGDVRRYEGPCNPKLFQGSMFSALDQIVKS